MSVISLAEAVFIDTSFLATGTQALQQARAEFTAMTDLIRTLMPALDDRTQARARQVYDQLSGFSPVVTIVGQVKAGKTALINVLAARPGLLPSDVNPWTSVVTTLHINRPGPQGTSAEFSFFERDDWDRLMRGGGRLGEMAQRADAANEMRELERQILEVRKKSQERLGKNFEFLLGQRHRYDHFNTPLIERYVCIGDPDAAEGEGKKQGRFADLTRSADLYLDIPAYPFAMSIQDTPGVNDPFLLREQITLHCIRAAELCVVVLSASQALNTIDLALIRLLALLDSRQIVVFVNRIDELDHPSLQIPEIRAALRATLAKHGIGDAVDIVFGSARWAEAAVTGRLDELSDASQQSLFDWVTTAPIPEESLPPVITWHLSGMPELLAAIGVSVRDGSARHILQSSRQHIKGILAQSYADLQGQGTNAGGVTMVRLSETEVRARLLSFAPALQTELETGIAAIAGELKVRMAAASQAFVDTTVAAMIRHIAVHGSEGQWECDPARLRMQLRTDYLGFSRTVGALALTVLSKAAKEMSWLYRDLLDDAASTISLEPPIPPLIPAPVAIGKTIVVDLRSGWWTQWLRLRRTAEAFSGQYRALITAETDTILQAIEANHVANVSESVRLALSEFLSDHAAAVTEIARLKLLNKADLRLRVGAGDQEERRARLDSAALALDRIGSGAPMAGTDVDRRQDVV